MECILVCDVVLDVDQGRITIFGLPDQPGNCAKLFSAIALAGIVVDMIVQNLSGPGQAEMSFSVPRSDLPRAVELTKQVLHGIAPAGPVVPGPGIPKLFCLRV